MYVHTFEHEGEIWTRGVISSVNGQTDNQTFLMNEIIHVVNETYCWFSSGSKLFIHDSWFSPNFRRKEYDTVIQVLMNYVQ